MAASAEVAAEPFRLAVPAGDADVQQHEGGAQHAGADVVGGVAAARGAGAGAAERGDLGAVAQPNAPLYATFGKKRFTGLRLALMPLDLFPPPAKGAYAAVKATALAARAPNPRAERHRLRLDRYDESDFTALRTSMAEEGLWVT